MQAGTRQALSSWMRQFGLAIAVYIAMLVIATCALVAVNTRPIRTALVLAPILPGLALIGLTIRAYIRCDEFIQLRILQAAALAALVVAAFTLIYFFLGLLGLPHLSVAWISNILWAIFMAQLVRLMATDK
jgi:hypothetical protein